MSKTNLSLTETEHIAKLANLSLSGEEKQLFKEQLTEILDFVEKIAEVDTKTTEPLPNVVERKNVFREDKVLPSLTQVEALANARSTYKGYFRIKAVFDR